MSTLSNSTKKLLTALFGKTPISIDGLCEVLEKTDNPDMAIELLLGDYKQPDFPQTSKQKIDYTSETKVDCTYISFDKWNDRVYYNYEAVEILVRYLPKDIDQATVTFENIASLGTTYGTGTRTVRVNPEGKMVTTKTYTSSESWLRGANSEES